MKKNIRNRVACFICALLLFCTCLPFFAFAVDPVSAGVMANAFAQAIAAYGAANGAAMTFDVSSTSSIGETVHELWADFRAGTQDADDYETLAAALFPDLYYKVVTAAGTAAEAATIGYNISAEYAEEFDNFWNWLLSGPAEMVQVDNQYYLFQQSQIGPSAIPITVYSVGDFSGQPVPWYDYHNQSASLVFSTGIPFFTDSSNRPYHIAMRSQNQYNETPSGANAFVFMVYDSGAGTYRPYGYCFDYDPTFYYVRYNGVSYGTLSSLSNTANVTIDGTTYHLATSSTTFSSGITSAVPVYESLSSGMSALLSWVDSPVYSDSIGVKAYDNTGVASFPDTADPNYDAVAKRIPSDVPWDDSLFGDGTGTMTDAQSQAAAENVDDVIERDKTLPLAGDQTTNPPSDEDPPSSDPDDYMVLGLEDVFPFCIPFDIYNFLAALSAAPVAPHFVCTLDFPDAIGGEQTIDIDFDTPTFNQLAQLLRTLELLAFIVGLALLTRSMFIRG